MPENENAVEETNENVVEQQKPEEANEENSNESDFDSLPKWAQDEIKKHRNQEKNVRKAKTVAETKAQAEQDKNAKLMKALVEAGIIEGEDDAEIDPQAFKSAQREASQSKIELAVLRSANKLDADAESLLDSRSFMKTVNDLDPKSDDFLSDIEDAVNEAVGTNDRLKKTPTKKQPEKRSGGDFSAGGAGQRQITEADLVNMTTHEIAEAHKKGLLAKAMGINS